MPLVGLAHPVGKICLVALDDADAVVGRPSVNDHVFQLGVALGDDRAERRLDEPALVERGRYDGDSWMALELIDHGLSW